MEKPVKRAVKGRAVSLLQDLSPGPWRLLPGWALSAGTWPCPRPAGLWVREVLRLLRGEGGWSRSSGLKLVSWLISGAEGVLSSPASEILVFTWEHLSNMEASGCSCGRHPGAGTVPPRWARPSSSASELFC